MNETEFLEKDRMAAIELKLAQKAQVEAEAEKLRADANVSRENAEKLAAENKRRRTFSGKVRSTIMVSASLLGLPVVGTFWYLTVEKPRRDAANDVNEAREKKFQVLDKIAELAVAQKEVAEKRLTEVGALLTNAEAKFATLERENRKLEANFKVTVNDQKATLMPDPSSRGDTKSLNSATTSSGLEGRIAKAVLGASIDRGFFIATSPKFAAKYKNCESKIRKSGLQVEGKALGLFDLTLFGAADHAILFTDEKAYFYVDSLNSFEAVTLDELDKSTAARSGSYRVTINTPQRKVGPVVFAGSDVSADDFVVFVEAFVKGKNQ